MEKDVALFTNGDGKEQVHPRLFIQTNTHTPHSLTPSVSLLLARSSFIFSFGPTDVRHESKLSSEPMEVQESALRQAWQLDEPFGSV